MATALESAISAGLAAVRSMHGAAVTYARGASTLTLDYAVQGESAFDTISPDSGAETVIEPVDWLIEASKLTLGEPSVGDLITRRIGTTDYVYSVESPGPGQLHFEISDTGRTTYRIHTRLDGSGRTTTTNDIDLAGNEVRLSGT